MKPKCFEKPYLILILLYPPFADLLWVFRVNAVIDHLLALLFAFRLGLSFSLGILVNELSKAMLHPILPAIWLAIRSVQERVIRAAFLHIFNDFPQMCFLPLYLLFCRWHSLSYPFASRCSAYGCARLYSFIISRVDTWA